MQVTWKPGIFVHSFRRQHQASKAHDGSDDDEEVRADVTACRSGEERSHAVLLLLSAAGAGRRQQLLEVFLVGGGGVRFGRKALQQRSRDVLLPEQGATAVLEHLDAKFVRHVAVGWGSGAVLDEYVNEASRFESSLGVRHHVFVRCGAHDFEFYCKVVRIVERQHLLVLVRIFRVKINVIRGRKHG